MIRLFVSLALCCAGSMALGQNRLDYGDGDLERLAEEQARERARWYNSGRGRLVEPSRHPQPRLRHSDARFESRTVTKRIRYSGSGNVVRVNDPLVVFFPVDPDLTVIGGSLTIYAQSAGRYDSEGDILIGGHLEGRIVAPPEDPRYAARWESPADSFTIRTTKGALRISQIIMELEVVETAQHVVYQDPIWDGGHFHRERYRGDIERRFSQYSTFLAMVAAETHFIIEYPLSQYEFFEEWRGYTQDIKDAAVEVRALSAVHGPGYLGDDLRVEMENLLTAIQDAQPMFSVLSRARGNADIELWLHKMRFIRETVAGKLGVNGRGSRIIN